jgi:MFS transporter, DHA1 family, tetracycline resistance protein
MTASPASRHAITFIFITVFLDMVGFGLILPVLPKLIESVGHVSIGDAALVSGWMFFAFSMAQFLFGPTMGNLSDAFGRRPLLLLAVLGLFIDYLIMSYAPSISWLYFGRALAGLCGSSYVIANAYIADVTAPENRAKAFGLMGAAFGMGFVIGPAIGGMIGEYGARLPFQVAAGVAALNLIYGFFVLPETLPKEKRRAFDWKRANPLGTFNVFRNYPGVLPLCAVLATYFFATSVYPAIWPFWGIAKFGWSEWIIGVTLAVFGIVTAIFQGTMSGPAVKRFGEHKSALIGMISALIVAFAYGFAPNFMIVMILLVVHGPEGFVHPMLSAIMSKAVSEDAQGELQGGISSIMNIAMLAGTVFFTQLFGHFMLPNPIIVSPNVAFYVAGLVMVLSVALFLRAGLKESQPAKI